MFLRRTGKTTGAGLRVELINCHLLLGDICSVEEIAKIGLKGPLASQAAEVAQSDDWRPTSVLPRPAQTVQSQSWRLEGASESTEAKSCLAGWRLKLR